MIRDHQLKGMVLTQTRQDKAFDVMALALETLPDVSLYHISPQGLPPSTGFLLTLTDRLCATIYWHEGEQFTEGGWTFHPGDSKTIATYMVDHLDSPEQKLTIRQALDALTIDRRYDEKLTLLTTSLVHGLETRNRELSRALTQVQQLNHKVVESERFAAIGQLCAVIAHEIRNPLGLIDLYAKLVETQLEHAQPEAFQTGEALAQTKEQLFGHLSLIRQSTAQLESILGELTDYSRPLTLDTQPTDLAHFLQEIGRFYQPSFTEKGVILKFDTSPEPEEESIWVPIDRNRIRQALINLLKNALEVSPEGSTVSLRLCAVGSHIRIHVSDEGPGVPAQVAEKLFTPYFSTKSGGTGLGLAHSRKILQAHGGSVELVPNNGKGATFALVFPKPSSTAGGTLPEALLTTLQPEGSTQR